MSGPYNHLGPIWYQSEPSDFPYSPNQFLGWDFFCCFLQQNSSTRNTGTPPLTRFFGPWKNRVKGKPRYRRSILVLKPQNGEFEASKSTFSLVFTSAKLQLQSLHSNLS